MAEQSNGQAKSRVAGVLLWVASLIVAPMIVWYFTDQYHKKSPDVVYEILPVTRFNKSDNPFAIAQVNIQNRGGLSVSDLKIALYPTYMAAIKDLSIDSSRKQMEVSWSQSSRGDSEHLKIDRMHPGDVVKISAHLTGSEVGAINFEGQYSDDIIKPFSKEKALLDLARDVNVGIYVSAIFAALALFFVFLAIFNLRTLPPMPKSNEPTSNKPKGIAPSDSTPSA